MYSLRDKIEVAMALSGSALAGYGAHEVSHSFLTDPSYRSPFPPLLVLVVFALMLRLTTNGVERIKKKRDANEQRHKEGFV